ncbi:unnamed protein product [Cochlearia groenlandica]
MALDSSGDQSDHQKHQRRVSSVTVAAELKLNRTPNEDHEPESYEDLPLEFPPSLFSSLERYLPDQLLGSSRPDKARFMRDIVLRHSPDTSRIRIVSLNLCGLYLQRLHEEIYTIDPAGFFAPSFLEAVVRQRSKESIRSIMVESFPGIFTFQMFSPRFCQMLLEEVEHMERWIYHSRTSITRPNTMNRFGVVLGDFGFESMLQKLVDDFISPLSQVLFPEVGGSSLDSQHGYIVEYGKDWDVDLGFHVDDSEVSLNVCLGKQFSGGELYFRGVRCEKHVNSKTSKEEVYDYSHVPGQAILHCGRHRHGARATTSGHRVNLILWCRSSTFRETKNYRRDFSSWCGDCKVDKQNRLQESAKAARELLAGGASREDTNMSSPSRSSAE